MSQLVAMKKTEHLDKKKDITRIMKASHMLQLFQPDFNKKSVII
jgi:hypothetical protein